MDTIDDISTKLKTNYKQPIVLHQNNAADFLAQMKRIRYCFKLLEYKIVLQAANYLITLTDDNMIEVYKIEDYTAPSRSNAATFCILVQLEQFYSKMENIHKTIYLVEKEFYEILNLNQEKHKEYLDSDAVKFFISNNETLLQNKEKLHEGCAELGQTLRKILQREKKLENDLLENQTKITSNIYRDTEKVRDKNEIEKQLLATKQLKDTIFDKIVELDSKVKSIYLIIDQLGFNLSLAFNELRSEVNYILKNLDSV
jgi:hypothetical protein